MDKQKLFLSVQEWLEGLGQAGGDIEAWAGDGVDDLAHPPDWESEDDTAPPMPDTQGYRDVAFESPAFKWLLAAMGRELILTPGSTYDAAARLRARILDAFPQKQAISSRSAAPVFTMEFELHWEIGAFMNTQYREKGKQARLGDVITITGTGTDAQALTCSEYLDQTWPCTGAGLLATVQEALDTLKSASRRWFSKRSRLLPIANTVVSWQENFRTEPESLSTFAPTPSV